jgi:hypothetical protein
MVTSLGTESIEPNNVVMLNPNARSPSRIVVAARGLSSSAPALSAQRIRTVVLATASASKILQRRLSAGGSALAASASEPALSSQRFWTRATARPGAAVSAAVARTPNGVSCRGIAGRGPAPSITERRFFNAAMRTAGMLRTILDQARTIVPAFLQRGVSLGFTSRVGSGVALPRPTRRGQFRSRRYLPRSDRPTDGRKRKSLACGGPTHVRHADACLGCCIPSRLISIPAEMKWTQGNRNPCVQRNSPSPAGQELLNTNACFGAGHFLQR